MQKSGSCNGFAHFVCRMCAHERFLNPESQSNAALYEEDADYNADLSIAGNPEDLIQWSHREAISCLEKRHFSGTPAILDVGCFNGFFVVALRAKGYDATGIDFNKRAIAYGRSVYGLGSAIGTETLEELLRAGRRYDVITMFEVIEHLDDFPAVIDSAVALLNPGGLFIVSTPNSRMLWRPSLDTPPHHLSRFSPESLRHLLRSRGLHVSVMLEQMSIFDLFRNYSGSFLRKKDNASMRGGKFIAPAATDVFRRIANKSKRIFDVVLWPANKLLHIFGFRYISQVAIAERS